MGLLDSIGLILFVGVEQDTLMKERADAAAQQSTSKRKPPTCRTCGKPRKGHSKGACVNTDTGAG